MAGDLREDLGPSESEDVEWKRDAKDRDQLRRAICALANDLPERGRGHLIVGVQNDGQPTRLRVHDELLLQVTNIRDEGRILPRPVMSAARATFAGADGVHVRAEPSRVRPVRFDGVVWIRVGTSSLRASREEEVLLTERSRAGDLGLDQHPVPDTSAADLDLELFRSTYLPAAVDSAVIEENRRTLSQQMASLGLVDLATGEARVLGLLVLGIDPTTRIPGAYVQFVRYEGSDEASTIVDHLELRGNLVIQLDELRRLLPANVRTAVEATDALTQGDRPDYPIDALRELVLNALVHRDYEHFNAPVRLLWFADRIEITSPGGPYGVVTRETFAERNDYRNPTLAAAMKSLGFVNRFGRGIALVRASLAKNGNPPAEFRIEDHYWSVAIRRAS